MGKAGHAAWWASAQEELAAAKVLRTTGKNDQAYQHAGQAIEFALKAIYIRKKNLSELPATCKGANWHSLPLIASQAGLDQDITALKGNRTRQANWLAVRDWQSNGRFPGNKPSRKEANDLILAVSQDRDGVMAWLDELYQKS